jgi:hypothetical protein
MKILFFVLLLHYQNSEEQVGVYKYSFKIENIFSRADAKEFAENSRGLFDCIPLFDEDLDEFKFSSEIPYMKKEVEEKLSNLGYKLTEFQEY